MLFMCPKCLIRTRWNTLINICDFSALFTIQQNSHVSRFHHDYNCFVTASEEILDMYTIFDPNRNEVMINSTNFQYTDQSKNPITLRGGEKKKTEPTEQGRPELIVILPLSHKSGPLGC